MLDGLMARAVCLDRSGSPAPSPPLLAPPSPVMARREINAMREVMELRTEVDGLRDLLAREAQQRTRCLKDLARNISQIHTDAEDRQGQALHQVREDFQEHLRELQSQLSQQQGELKSLCSAIRGPLNREVLEQRLQLVDERLQLLGGVHAPLERRVELLGDLLEALQKRQENADERYSSLDECLRRKHDSLEQQHEQLKREQQGDVGVLLAHFKEEAAAHQREFRRCDEELCRVGQRMDDLTSLEHLFRQFEQRLESIALHGCVKDKRYEQLDARLCEAANDVVTCSKAQQTAKIGMEQFEEQLSDLKRHLVEKFVQKEGLTQLDERISMIGDSLQKLTGKQALCVEQLSGIVDERLMGFAQAQDASRESLEQRVQKVTLQQDQCMQRLQRMDVNVCGGDRLVRGNFLGNSHGENLEIWQEFRGRVLELERRMDSLAAGAQQSNGVACALSVRDHERLGALEVLERRLQEHVTLFENRRAQVDDIFVEITDALAEDLDEMSTELTRSRGKLEAIMRKLGMANIDGSVEVPMRTESPDSSTSEHNIYQTRQSRLSSLSRRISESRNSVDRRSQQAMPAQDRGIWALQASVADLDKNHSARIGTLEQLMSSMRTRLVAVDDLDVRVRVMGEQLQNFRQAQAASVDKLKHSVEEGFKRASLTQEERLGLVVTTKEVLAWEQRFGSLVSLLRSEIARLEAGREIPAAKQETHESMNALSERMDRYAVGLAKEGRVRDDAIRRLGEIIRQ